MDLKEALEELNEEEEPGEHEKVDTDKYDEVSEFLDKDGQKHYLIEEGDPERTGELVIIPFKCVACELRVNKLYKFVGNTVRD